MNQNILRAMRFPAAFVALMALVMAPALFASAAEGEEGSRRPVHRGPRISVEIVSIDSEDGLTGTIEATRSLVPDRLAEKFGVETGDSISIIVTEETKLIEEKEEATLDDFENGDVIFVVGFPNVDESTLNARLISDHRIKKYHPRIGEVVKVDTDANTILVKGLRQDLNRDDVYVLVTYTDETVIHEDGEEADESAISVGDMIRARGEVNTESDEYVAEVSADNIVLFDETEPKIRPGHRPRGDFQPDGFQPQGFQPVE